MKNVNKISKVVAKVLEIVHWVAACFMVATAICSTAVPKWLGYLTNIETAKKGTEIEAYGFEVTLTNSAGEINTTTLLLFAIGAFLLYVLVAMIFRNIYLIIKKSEDTTPFQKDNIRMLREIGIFSIAIPIIGLIMSILVRLIVGVNAVDTSVNLNGFVMGIIVLCLTQFFAYGAKLEKDVDGLL